MHRFSRYIGIDYSGAETPRSRLPRLRVFGATPGSEPVEINTTAGDGTRSKVMRWNWTRREVAHWLVEQLKAPGTAIVGIDHGFSFPDSYFKRYGIDLWDEFLEDFFKHWPTAQDHVCVDDIREQRPLRIGRANEFRLTEKRAKGTQSVFKFDGQGTVGKSTHTGIPWLRFLRRHPDLRGRLHFWPFDGFDVPPGKSVVAEVWPTLFRKKYRRPEGWKPDQFDAYVVAKWLQETQGAGELERQFLPPPGVDEKMVLREGWILGAPNLD